MAKVCPICHHIPAPGQYGYKRWCKACERVTVEKGMKRCARCLKEFPATTEHFSVEKVGLASYCRPCNTARCREERGPRTNKRAVAEPCKLAAAPRDAQGRVKNYWNVTDDEWRAYRAALGDE